MKLCRMLLSTSLAALLSTTVFAAEDKKTERLWKAKCASCHGSDGKAQTEKGKEMKIESMASPEFQAKKDEVLTKAITDGVKKQESGVKKEMDPYKDELTTDQISALLSRIRSFK